MKKLVFTPVFAVILNIVVFGQNNSIVLTKTISAVDKEQNVKPGLSKNTPVQFMNAVNAKALKDFAESNTKAENVTWYDNPKGFFAYYTKDGNQGRSFYNKKGRFAYNILSYPEQFLPYKVRDMVKREYYLDYKITWASEVLTKGKTAFIVNITDGKTWKIIRVCDDEPELINEYYAK